MQNNDLFAWWKQGIFYHIYPQSFKDSNHDGIGDLQGIIQKLDYLQNLGIDAVWLSPIYLSPLIDGGYDISDYQNIHPRYGNMDDFEQLLDEAHKRNIHVLMDLVLNHTSDQHSWFLESRSSKNNAKRNWYLWLPPRNNKTPNGWKTNFGKKAWQYDEQTGEYYHHSFFKEQPDLNWWNSEVRDAMFKIVKFWLDKGVDGFRLDVVNLLFKDKHFRNNPAWISQDRIFNRNQPEVYKLLKEFRLLLNQYPNRISVGEIYTPPPGDPKLAASFLGDAFNMLHLVFDFSLVFAVWRASAYRKIIERYYKQIPADGWACFFLSNHDIGRSVKRVGFSFYKYSKAKLHALLLLTLKGTPFIYYGDEIGMENVRIPKRKIQDLYGKLFYPFFRGRDQARTPMQWNTDEYAGFSMEEPWLPVAKNYPKINVESECKDNNSILSTYRKLLEIRKKYTVLRTGGITFLNRDNKNVLAYVRHLENQKIAIFLNFGFCKKKITFNNKGYVGLMFSTHEQLIAAYQNYIVLQPFEGIILKIADNPKNG